MTPIVIPAELPPVNQKIIELAQRSFPIIEDPPGSNRSPEIDRMCKRWGVPFGSAWCALWTTDTWFDAGAQVPTIRESKGWHPAKAETWRLWALENGFFYPSPVLGAAALYGPDGHEPAHHISCCVVRILDPQSAMPIVYNLEGNTSETGFSREGTLTELKRVNVERLIGYVYPQLRDNVGA